MAKEVTTLTEEKLLKIVETNGHFYGEYVITQKAQNRINGAEEKRDGYIESLIRHLTKTTEAIKSVQESPNALYRYSYIKDSLKDALDTYKSLWLEAQIADDTRYLRTNAS